MAVRFFVCCVAACVGLSISLEIAAEEQKASSRAADNKSNDPEWNGHFTLGFQTSGGNSDTTSLHVDFEAKNEDHVRHFLLGAESSYGESDSDTTENSSNARIDYRLLQEDDWYYNFSSRYYRNSVSAVTYRINFNAAMGKFVIHRRDLRFHLEAGPTYIFERVAGGEDDYLAPRIGQRLEWKISEHAHFFEEVDITAEVDDPSNHIVVIETGLEFPIFEPLIFRFEFDVTYDHEPAPDKKRRDVKLVSSFGAKF